MGEGENGEEDTKGNRQVHRLREGRKKRERESAMTGERILT